MAVATRLGLKDEIVKKADKYLSAEFKEISDWIQRVTDEKNRISETMGEIESQYKEVESIRFELNKQVDYLIQNRQKILDSIHHTAEEKYKDIETLLKKAQMAYSWVKHTNENPDSIKQDMDEVEKELKSLRIEKPESTIEKPNDEAFQTGDTVTVRGLNLTGVITKYNQLTQIAELKIGNLRMDVDISRLDKNTSEYNSLSSSEPAKSGHNKSLIEHISYSNKIDIRGMRAEPSLQIMENFLDESLKNGLSKVFIVHGKGTGALRKAIRESLEGHPLVNSFGSEPDALGEDGATYVLLN
jgi:DNA mismatch repair protein MutS2